MFKIATSSRSNKPARNQRLWAVAAQYSIGGGSISEGIVRTAATFSEIAINLIPVSATYSRSGRVRSYDKALYPIRTFVGLLTRINKGDTILAVTKPCTAPVWVSVAALIRGTSYVYIWVEESHVGPDGSGNALVSTGLRIREHFERWALKYVEHVVVDSLELANIAAKKTDGLNIPVHLVAVLPERVEFSVNPHYVA